MAETRRGPRRSTSATTIADVARAAQCSPMTVSRVINGEGNVREAMRSRVLEAAKRLSYSPNRAARSLAGGEQMRIALLLDNPSASYLSEFLMGALDEASRRDVQLVVQSCDNVAEGRVMVESLAASGITGFILPPPLCDDQMVLDLVNARGKIAVAVGPGRAEGAHFSLLIDEFRAAYDMTRHIIALGHERIGFIIGNPEQLASGRRLKGFRAAMEEAGLAVSEALVAQGQFTYRSGMIASEELLSASPRPTAIFASNDDMAAATVAVAHRRQLDVPGDVSVCGFDDTELARSIWPELTTIRQPIRAMTTSAVAMIVKHARAKAAPGQHTTQEAMFPYELIRRNSDTAPGL